MADESLLKLSARLPSEPLALRLPVLVASLPVFLSANGPPPPGTSGHFMQHGVGSSPLLGSASVPSQCRFFSSWGWFSSVTSSDLYCWISPKRKKYHQKVGVVLESVTMV